MRTLVEIKADLEGPVATLAATLRRMGKAEAEVEATVANIFNIRDAGSRRALGRLLSSTLVAEDLDREFANSIFEDIDDEAASAASDWGLANENGPMLMAADPGGYSTDPDHPSEVTPRLVKRVTISGRPFDLTLGLDDDIVLSGAFEPAWQALEADGVRYELREDAGQGRRRVEGLGRNGFDLAEASPAASRPRFVP